MKIASHDFLSFLYSFIQAKALSPDAIEDWRIYLCGETPFRSSCGLRDLSLGLELERNLKWAESILRWT